MFNHSSSAVVPGLGSAKLLLSSRSPAESTGASSAPPRFPHLGRSQENRTRACSQPNVSLPRAVFRKPSGQKQSPELSHVGRSASLPVFLEESSHLPGPRAPGRFRVSTQHTGLSSRVSAFHLDHWPTPKAGFKRPVDQGFQFAQLLNSYIKVDLLAPLGPSDGPSFNLHCVGGSSISAVLRLF